MEDKHLNNLLELAKAVATVAHENQYDKSGRPYIEHPMTVASFCTTIEAKIVGWLHDVVEDTSVTIEDLRHIGFDEKLLEALRCVTKEAGYDIKEYYARIKANPIAKEVKLADLRHNSDVSRMPKDAPAELIEWVNRKHDEYAGYIEYLKS